MFALTFLGDICVAVGAYVAAIYTWPTVRTWLVGAEAEVKSLEARIAALKSAITGK